MKGIVLAGGSGSRLRPLTSVISKQLLPIYDKPMVYYSISVLMLSGIREILIISTINDLPLYKQLLGTGSQFGLQFEYIVQEKPAGIAQAFILGEGFIGKDTIALILGDNIFYGAGLKDILLKAKENLTGAMLFGAVVQDPSRYGVACIENGKVTGIIEKPSTPPSNIAITGLYFYDNNVINIAKNIKPSSRGELEITDINNDYILNNHGKLQILQRGTAWLDTGTPDSLLEAGQFVATLQKRQGTYIACLEEIAYNLGYISTDMLLEESHKYTGDYALYLRSLVNV